MLELLAIALLAVGSLPPLEPQARQKPLEAASADQAAASAAKAAAPAKPAAAPQPVKAPAPAPARIDLGPVASPEIRSEGHVPDKAEAAPEPLAVVEPPKKPVPKPEKKAKKAAKAERAEAEQKHEARPAEDGKEPAKPDAESPTEDQQHAAAPSLAPGAICDELRRAARDRREDRFKLTQEREALTKERTRLEALAEEIAQARSALKEETARLQAVIDKVNEKAKGPVKPGLPLPGGKPTAAGAGGGASLADAVRK